MAENLVTYSYNIYSTRLLPLLTESGGFVRRWIKFDSHRPRKISSEWGKFTKKEWLKRRATECCPGELVAIPASATEVWETSSALLKSWFPYLFMPCFESVWLYLVIGSAQQSFPFWGHRLLHFEGLWLLAGDSLLRDDYPWAESLCRDLLWGELRCFWISCWTNATYSFSLLTSLSIVSYFLCHRLHVSTTNCGCLSLNLFTPQFPRYEMKVIPLPSFSFNRKAVFVSIMDVIFTLYQWWLKAYEKVCFSELEWNRIQQFYGHVVNSSVKKNIILLVEQKANDLVYWMGWICKRRSSRFWTITEDFILLYANIKVDLRLRECPLA